MTSSNESSSSSPPPAFTVPATMTAIVVRELGGPESLSFETDYPVPSELSAGQVLVRNDYAGLNFIDTYYRSGLYKQPVPFIAGQEGAGIVVNKHESVPDDDVKVGDRVVYSTLGTYCGYTRVPSDKILKIGAGADATAGADISIEAALCGMVQGLTAHYLVTDATAGLAQKGDWMLVYSVGSGTCQWACQLAKTKGYRVIGTTSSGKVTPAAKAACEHLIVLDTASEGYADYASVDIRSKVMELTSGEGVKVVVDGVGKSTADISIGCLARRGLWISFGNASGAVPPLSVLKLTPKSAYVTRPKLGDYVATKEELRARAAEVFGCVASRELTVNVDVVFPLSEAQRAHEYLEAGKSKGKILFKID